MLKSEKEVARAQLKAEKAVLKEIEAQYKQALDDIDEKIASLLGRNDADMQNVIYQVQYQRQLKTQVQAILEQLQANEFETISEFLAQSYQDGFIGAMYTMNSQGVPIISPIDQNAVIKAIQTDSKLNHDLYTELGVDITKLKKSVTSEITRGVATGMMYDEIARNISLATKAPLSRTKTIVRTEAHRIQQASAHDAYMIAKSKGADVVKQWDSTLDGDTRPTHQQLDGQIVELEEPFKVAGKKAMYPGGFGDPAQDCNCRCRVNQRAKWALGKEELQTLKDRAEYFGLDKSDSFKEFEKKYMKAVQKSEIAADPLRIDRMAKEEFEQWKEKYYNSTNSKVNLTESELKALYEYGEGGYELLNAYGRYGADSKEFQAVLKKYGNPDVDTVGKRFDDVQNALDKFQLDEDIVVHRAVRDVSYITDDVTAEGLKNLKGQVITEEGFVSTSFSYQSTFTGRKQDAVHMEIVVPEGTHGAYIDKFVSKDEQEFLLPAGTTYKVTDGGVRIIKENKYDFKSREWIENEKEERFLKVEVVGTTPTAKDTKRIVPAAPTSELEQKRKAVSQYMESLGANVDEDGLVTLYHATDKTNVPKINKDGFKPTNAPINGGTGGEDVKERVFFGYDKEWVADTWADSGNYEIMEVKIPAEYLHQAGKNTLEVFVEGTITPDGDGIWTPDILPTSTAWDRKTIKRWVKKLG